MGFTKLNYWLNKLLAYRKMFSRMRNIFACLKIIMVVVVLNEIYIQKYNLIKKY